MNAIVVGIKMVHHPQYPKTLVMYPMQKLVTVKIIERDIVKDQSIERNLFKTGKCVTKIGIAGAEFGAKIAAVHCNINNSNGVDILLSQ